MIVITVMIIRERRKSDIEIKSEIFERTLLRTFGHSQEVHDNRRYGSCRPDSHSRIAKDRKELDDTPARNGDS